MSHPLQQTALVAAQITAEWITREFKQPATLTIPGHLDDTLPLLTLRVGDAGACIAVVPLWDIAADSETLTRKTAMEQRLAELEVGPIVAWIPPMAEIPTDDADAFVSLVAAAADALEPGSRGEIALPVKLRLRRNGAEGSYLNAMGGLAQQWARFTGQVMGQYQLDAGAIHRLPEDPEKVTQLIDFLVLVANGLREVGASRDVDAADTWTVQRLAADLPPTLIAASPHELTEDGTAVRKRLRAGLRAAATALADTDAAIKIVTLVGLYRSLGHENAAIALRGMDPSVFGHFDCACLVADGDLKPLFGPRPGSVLRA